MDAAGKQRDNVGQRGAGSQDSEATTARSQDSETTTTTVTHMMAWPGVPALIACGAVAAATGVPLLRYPIVTMVAAFLVLLCAVATRLPSLAVAHVFVDNSNIVVPLLAHHRRVRYAALRTAVLQHPAPAAEWAWLAAHLKPRFRAAILRRQPGTLYLTGSKRRDATSDGAGDASSPTSAAAPEAPWVKAARAAGFKVTQLTRVQRAPGWVGEEGVDDDLHKNMANAALDVQAAPWYMRCAVWCGLLPRPVMVQVSGDGNGNYGKSSFPEQLSRAMRAGMDVEVVSWQASLSATYKALHAKRQAAERSPLLRLVHRAPAFTIRYLDDIADDVTMPARRRRHRSRSRGRSASASSQRSTDSVESADAHAHTDAHAGEDSAASRRPLRLHAHVDEPVRTHVCRGPLPATAWGRGAQRVAACSSDTDGVDSDHCEGNRGEQRDCGTDGDDGDSKDCAAHSDVEGGDDSNDDDDDCSNSSDGGDVSDDTAAEATSPRSEGLSVTVESTDGWTVVDKPAQGPQQCEHGDSQPSEDGSVAAEVSEEEDVGADATRVAATAVASPVVNTEGRAATPPTSDTAADGVAAAAPVSSTSAPAAFQPYRPRAWVPRRRTRKDSASSDSSMEGEDRRRPSVWRSQRTAARRATSPPHCQPCRLDGQQDGTVVTDDWTRFNKPCRYGVRCTLRKCGFTHPVGWTRPPLLPGEAPPRGVAPTVAARGPGAATVSRHAAHRPHWNSNERDTTNHHRESEVSPSTSAWRAARATSPSSVHSRFSAALHTTPLWHR